MAVSSPSSYKFIFFLFVGILSTNFVFSQNPDIIRVKMNRHFLVFLQKGIKSDTIVKNQNDIFYLLVADSLKKKIIVSVENGQIVRTDNDSLVTLQYLPGLKYEYVYEVPDDKTTLPTPKQNNYLSLINGISNHTTGKILIRILDKKTGYLINELDFWYRPG